MNKPVKILKGYFTRDYDFMCIKREGSVAIFKNKDPFGGPQVFEVVLIQLRENCERPPDRESAGRFWWRYFSLEEAELKFQEILERRAYFRRMLKGEE